jgi:hypothetical protein
MPSRAAWVPPRGPVAARVRSRPLAGGRGWLALGALALASLALGALALASLALGALALASLALEAFVLASLERRGVLFGLGHLRMTA